MQKRHGSFWEQYSMYFLRNIIINILKGPQKVATSDTRWKNHFENITNIVVKVLTMYQIQNIL